MHHIYFDVLIDATMAPVFGTIADPDFMIHWWLLRCSGEMKLGGRTISISALNMIGMARLFSLKRIDPFISR